MFCYGTDNQNIINFKCNLNLKSPKVIHVTFCGSKIILTYLPMIGCDRIYVPITPIVEIKGK